MKKCLFPLLMIMVIFCGCQNKRTVASIHGAEWDSIIMNDVIYVRDSADEYQNYSAADKDYYLGNAVGDGIEFRLYSVKGDETYNYLYAQWDYEGEFYVRQSLTNN